MEHDTEVRILDPEPNFFISKWKITMDDEEYLAYYNKILEWFDAHPNKRALDTGIFDKMRKEIDPTNSEVYRQAWWAAADYLFGWY